MKLRNRQAYLLLMMVLTLPNKISEFKLGKLTQL